MFSRLFLIGSLILCTISMPAMATNALDDIYSKFGEKLFTLKSKTEKHRIIVLYDVDCGYCQRLLTEEVPTLVENGVTISFYPYPKSGLQSGSAVKMIEFWNWENPLLKAYYPDKENKRIGGFTYNDLTAMYQYINKQLLVEGTPTTLLDDGNYVRGVFRSNELIQYLNQEG